MLQSGFVILEQYSLYFLFWRVKSDPSIKISALLIYRRDLIRMTSMLALETLKHIAFAVRLVQITAFWTCLRGVRRIDLLSATTCRRRLELNTFFSCRTTPITHSTRYLFTRPFSSNVQLFGPYHLRLSPFDQFVDRSIDLIRDGYFRSTFRFLRLFMA